ncbi:MAG: hypothetical protein AAB229_08150 [Candidatus Hydrogenedentota bacterium]
MSELISSASPSADVVATTGATPLSSRLYYGALAFLAVGFPSLTLVDARAENGWTFFACGAVISGYALLGASILCRRD